MTSQSDTLFYLKCLIYEKYSETHSLCIIEYSYIAITNWKDEESAIQSLNAFFFNGPNINCKNFDGLTPLHYASLTGHMNIVKYLISYGADLNVQTPKK